MNTDGWPEGKAEWWWKYVFPARERIWVALLQDKLTWGASEPTPQPYRAITAAILEGLVMLHATSSVAEIGIKQRLEQEAVAKISAAVREIAR